MTDKFVIDEKDVGKIRDYATRAFEEYRSFSTLDQREIQCLLIIEGLRHHLESNQIEPLFEVKIKKGKL